MASGNKGNSTKGRKRKLQEAMRLQVQRKRDDGKRAPVRRPA